MSAVLLMLAIHSNAQEKVYEELNGVFGLSGDVVIDNNSLKKLPYLEMVIKESMRLFPVLPVSARTVTEDLVIGKYTIPSGTNIFISTFQVHRNPKYWGDDANLFKPERFEPEQFRKIHPYAFIPFSGGPRICIGAKYGMLFMKTVLVNFLRKYKIKSNLKYDELDFEISISMKIVQRYMISLELR